MDDLNVVVPVGQLNNTAVSTLYAFAVASAIGNDVAELVLIIAEGA
jgi:hypothetical protein